MSRIVRIKPKVVLHPMLIMIEIIIPRNKARGKYKDWSIRICSLRNTNIYVLETPPSPPKDVITVVIGRPKHGGGMIDKDSNLPA